MGRIRLTEVTQMQSGIIVDVFFLIYGDQLEFRSFKEFLCFIRCLKIQLCILLFGIKLRADSEFNQSLCPCLNADWYGHMDE